MNSRLKGAISSAITSMVGAASATAQDDFGPDIAAAGNGGTATASANGGAVLIGDVNSGGNAGNAIAVGDTGWGDVLIDGGIVTSSTSISVSANGGTAIADASGGDFNFAFVS